MMNKIARTLLLAAVCMGLWQMGYSQQVVLAVGQLQNTSSGLTDDQAITLMGAGSSVEYSALNQTPGHAMIDDVVIDLIRFHGTKSQLQRSEYAYTDKVLTDTEIIIQYQEDNPYSVQTFHQGMTTGLTDDQAIELSKDYFGINPNLPVSYYATSVGNDQLLVCCSYTAVNCTCKDS